MIENQLTEFREKQQEKLQNLHKLDRNTTLIVGDCMFSGIEERRISKSDRKVKVKNFPGATIDDMYDYIKPLLRKCPDNITLHVGTITRLMSDPKWCLINCLI